MEWIHQKGDCYEITGKDVNGKRFKIYETNPFRLRCYNIYQGTFWLVRNGKRTVLWRVHN